MSTRFDENRMLLARIVYSQPGRFTERTITRLFKKKTGSLEVDAGHSIGSWLRLQIDFGNLAYKHGRYFTKADSNGEKKLWHKTKMGMRTSVACV